MLAISALVFGVAFFAVVGSTTAFVRFNYPPSAWPTGIAALTISFGIGQTLGPIVVGAITDAVGSLSFALNVSAAMLATGAVLCAFQRKLARWRIARHGEEQVTKRIHLPYSPRGSLRSFAYGFNSR